MLHVTSSDYADVVAWRRDLHAHPELQFDVHRTAALVAARLTGFGCDQVVTGVGRTGVVGVIHGKRRDSGKAVGLRADMDALPIEEESTAPWASTAKGVMHACGMTAIRQCCSARRANWRERGRSTARRWWCFSPPRKAGAAARRWWTTT